MDAESTDHTKTTDVMKSAARKTGLLYFLLMLLAPFHLIYVANRFIISGDPAATALRIGEAGWLYRIGILAGLTSNILFLVLVLRFYDMLKDVNRQQARLMVVLVVAGASLGLVNLLNQTAPLILLNGADYWSAFTRAQLEVLAFAFLRLRTSGSNIAMAFWALWLLPLGLLVLRSGFFPRLLGYLLIVGCVAYLTISISAIAAPEYRAMLERVLMPFYAIGEVAMIFWLMIKGVKDGAPHSNDSAIDRLAPKP